MSHISLPEDKNLLRLQECDFFLRDDLDCRLKTIKNPMIILFYFDDTDKGLLSEWFQVSRNTKYENGSIDDFSNPDGIEDEDLKFKVASVNLDYEINLKLRFRNLEKYNPFHWLKIPLKNEFPFIVFYYQTSPQLLYEGEVSSYVIENEFSSWRENFTDIEKPEIKEYLKEVLLDNTGKYFEAITDEIFFDGKIIQMKKGNLYKITVN